MLEKTDTKLAALYEENPEFFNIPTYLENQYGLSGYNEDGTPRTFWRGHRTTGDLIKMFPAMSPFVDQYRNTLGLREDDSFGCTESCEPIFDEDV